MPINVERATPYTVQKLADLQARGGLRRLIVEYRDDNGDRCRGPLLTAYIGVSGIECAQVCAFANFVYCSQITGHYFE